MNNIQWYPGHMTKTRRMMEENISLVDIVIELVDARIPYSSKNPDLDTLAKNKHRILLLNKCDLADERATDIWQEYFEKQGFRVIRINALKGNGLGEVTETARSLMKEKIEKLKARGRINVPIRSMIVGIPNVGKSTFINKYVGKVTAKTGDKPGVTRGKQWIKLKKDFELLDTPGILWPKFEDQQVGLKLAFTGAINDDILDPENMALAFFCSSITSISSGSSNVSLPSLPPRYSSIRILPARSKSGSPPFFLKPRAIAIFSRITCGSSIVSNVI